jgi:hypothetical protein
VVPASTPSVRGTKKEEQKPHTSRGVCILHPFGLRIQGHGIISPMERGRRVESLACRHRFCPVYHGRR